MIIKIDAITRNLVFIIKELIQHKFNDIPAKKKLIY